MPRRHPSLAKRARRALQICDFEVLVILRAAQVVLDYATGVLREVCIPGCIDQCGWLVYIQLSLDLRSHHRFRFLSDRVGCIGDAMSAGLLGVPRTESVVLNLAQIGAPKAPPQHT